MSTPLETGVKAGCATGRVALITGADVAVVRAIALGIARAGARVVVVARAGAEAVAEEIREEGCVALALMADVTDLAAAEEAVRAAVAAVGPIDILVNTGTQPVLGKLHEQAPDAWWAQMRSNLGGAYHVTRAVLAQMLARKWGRIVNVASSSGKVALKSGSAFCAATHALIGFTKALALEVADQGITVNVVCPGAFGSALNPQKAQLTPEDLVPSVLFLISDGGYRTTGESVNVSSGLVMHG